jgi:hypothetical protein
LRHLLKIRSSEPWSTQKQRTQGRWMKFKFEITYHRSKNGSWNSLVVGLTESSIKSRNLSKQNRLITSTAADEIFWRRLSKTEHIPGACSAYWKSSYCRTAIHICKARQCTFYYISRSLTGREKPNLWDNNTCLKIRSRIVHLGSMSLFGRHLCK